jgi:protein-L-isoaspartate(D-aspartate) O-methyltransferase
MKWDRSVAFFLALPLFLAAGDASAAGDESPPREKAAQQRMIDLDLKGRDIKDPRVLKAMAEVPRHAFVPAELRHMAYRDSPLPIGNGQTISQPYIVAFMTQALALKGHERVLEIGTGSGYQAAVLGAVAKEVYTIEIVPQLAKQAEETLKGLGYAGKIHVRTGDGYKGWPEKAPFDAVMVTAAPDHIPQPLVDQLKTNGRMILPVGGQHEIQALVLLTKKKDGSLERQVVMPVRFVPMTGEAQQKTEIREKKPEKAAQDPR